MNTMRLLRAGNLTLPITISKESKTLRAHVVVMPYRVSHLDMDSSPSPSAWPSASRAGEKKPRPAPEDAPRSMCDALAERLAEALGGALGGALSDAIADAVSGSLGGRPVPIQSAGNGQWPPSGAEASDDFLHRPVLTGRILGTDSDIAVVGFMDSEDAEELASEWAGAEAVGVLVDNAVEQANAMNMPFLLVKPSERARGGGIRGGAPRRAAVLGYFGFRG